jgi:hypothetical protein
MQDGRTLFQSQGFAAGDIREETAQSRKAAVTSAGADLAIAFSVIEKRENFLYGKVREGELGDGQSPNVNLRK